MGLINSSWSEVNHHALSKGPKGRTDWLVQMAKCAVSTFCRTGSVDGTLKVLESELRMGLEIEIKKGLVLSDLKKARIVLNPSVPEYNAQAARVEVAGWALGGSGSYLLTGKGAYLHGDENLPVTDRRQVAKCRLIRRFVSRHDPELGKKLVIAQPN